MTAGDDHAVLVNTFLIADIRGYSTYTQQHGDEAGARLASLFAEMTREVVEAQGGRVVELRGDEALAVFASPRQALRAAVALQERVAAHADEFPNSGLVIGIGLDAGEAVEVEVGGYRGGALNVAARLCSMAAPGRILASDVVHQLARKVEGLQYSDQGRQRLKGIEDAVRVWEVQREGGQLVPVSSSPMVAPARRPHAPIPFEGIGEHVARRIQASVHASLQELAQDKTFGLPPDVALFPRGPEVRTRGAIRRSERSAGRREDLQLVVVAGIVVGGVIVLAIIAAVVVIVLHF